MKYVVLYEIAPDGMEKIPTYFPAHRASWEKYRENGTLLMIGPFDTRQGALSVFTTREAAEDFVKNDPFVINGVVGKWSIHGWMEALT